MQHKKKVKVKAKVKVKEMKKEKEKAKVLRAKANNEENLKAKVKTKMNKDRSKIVVTGCIEANVLVAPNAAIYTMPIREEVEEDNLSAQAEQHLQATENQVRSPEEESLRLDYQTGHLVIIGYQENAKKETSATIFM